MDRSPVIVSTTESVVGPMPMHVTVPGSISVLPASVIIELTRRFASAADLMAYSFSRESTFRTTFFCPSEYHLSKVFGSFFFEANAQFTAACAAVPLRER